MAGKKPIIIDRKKYEIKKILFKEGIYKYKLSSNFFVPALGLSLGSVYALYSGNMLLATSAALASVIPIAPFLKKFKLKQEFEQNLIPNEEYKYSKDDDGNEVKERVKFCVQLGFEVLEHKATTKETSVDDNLVKPLLLETEKWCRHGIICGTTGSGKTVYLQYIAKQLLNQGAGLAFINGKPDVEMIKEMYSICALSGREQDFYYLDFTGAAKTMAMSVFDGTADGVDEIFKFMLGDKAENEWGQKALNLMASLLNLFMELKKHNLVFPHREVKKINNLQDLLALKHKYTMGFYLLDSYMTSSKLQDLITLFRRLYDQKDSKKYLDRITGADQKESIKQVEIHSKLISSLEKLTNLDYDFLTTNSFETVLKAKDDPFYSAGVAIDYWTEILSTFKEQYGEILDNTTPHININDIIRGHKFLYVALPGTSSENKLIMLGKMMVAQIKSAYERIQSSTPLEVPFTVFLDEFNSWSKGLKGFGDLISQTRSKRLAFYFLFQSSLETMDNGDLIEGGQILGNTNNVVILKIQQPKLIEEMVKFYGEEEVFKDSDNYIRRGFSDGDKTNLEQNLTIEKVNRITEKEIQDLQPGQCFIKLGSDVYRAIGGYHVPIRYETADSNARIPFEERYPKERFFSEFENYLNKSNSID